MDAIEAIYTRHSVRRYTDQPVSKEQLLTLLRAGMSGPSCVNARDWAFLAVRDRAMLCRMADANGSSAASLKNAQAAILVCGDISRSFSQARDYWIIDGAIAAQNITLAAHALGLGAVWLGTYPQMDRVAHQRELFHLPEHLIPHSIISLGYERPGVTQEDPDDPPKKSNWEEDRVHWETF